MPALTDAERAARDSMTGLTDAERAERKAAAEFVFMREGFIGLAVGASVAGSAHYYLQKIAAAPWYVGTNWRLKTLLACALSVAGFAIRSEKGWLEERDRLLLLDGERADAAEVARAHAVSAAAVKQKSANAASATIASSSRPLA